MPYFTWINVHYYHGMLPSCAHIFKLLTDQSGLITHFMDRQNSKGVCKMCLLMATNALAACPDHNKWFSTHTNTSDFQLGMCIIQEGRPVAYLQTDNITAKLYYIGKRNNFHHSYSCRILRYAP